MAEHVEVKSCENLGKGFFQFDLKIFRDGLVIPRRRMNKTPFSGRTDGSPTDLYYRIKGAKIEMEDVKKAAPPASSTKKVDLSKAEIAPPPPDISGEPSQDDLPGLSWDTGKKPHKPTGGHYSGTKGPRVTADSVWTKGQAYCSRPPSSSGDDGYGGCYDVGILTDIVSGNEVVPVKVSKISAKLRDNTWGTEEAPLSPFDVMSNPTFSQMHMKHMAKIRTADLSKPVIIRAKTWELIDGNHRLARCVYEGRDRILAVFVQEEQMSKAKLEV